MPGNTKRRLTKEQREARRQQSEWAKQVGQRIRDALNENKGEETDLAKTQRELSIKLGVTERLVSSWVAGDAMPWRHQAALSEHLGRTREWIMYGDNPPDADKQDQIISKLAALEAQTGDLRSSLDEILEVLKDGKRR